MEIEEPSLLEPQTVFETLQSDAKSLEETVETVETVSETLDIDSPEYNDDLTIDLDFSHLTVSHKPLGFKGSLLGKRRGLQGKIALVKKFGGSKEGQDALLKGLRWLQKRTEPKRLMVFSKRRTPVFSWFRSTHSIGSFSFSGLWRNRRTSRIWHYYVKGS